MSDGIKLFLLNLHLHFATAQALHKLSIECLIKKIHLVFCWYSQPMTSLLRSLDDAISLVELNEAVSCTSHLDDITDILGGYFDDFDVNDHCYTTLCLWKWAHFLEKEKQAIDLDLEAIEKDLHYQQLLHHHTEPDYLQSTHYNYNVDAHDFMADRTTVKWNLKNKAIYHNKHTIVHYIFYHLLRQNRELITKNDATHEPDMIQSVKQSISIIKLLFKYNVITSDKVLRPGSYYQSIFDCICEDVVWFDSIAITDDNQQKRKHKQVLVDGIFDLFLFVIRNRDENDALIKIKIVNDSWHISTLLKFSSMSRPEALQRLLFYGVSPFSIAVQRANNAQDIHLQCYEIDEDTFRDTLGKALNSSPSPHETGSVEIALTPLIMLPYLNAVKAEMFDIVCGMIHTVYVCTHGFEKELTNCVVSYLFFEYQSAFHTCTGTKMYEFSNWITHININNNSIFDQVFDEKFNNVEFAEAFWLDARAKYCISKMIDYNVYYLELIDKLIHHSPPQPRNYYYMLLRLIHIGLRRTTQAAPYISKWLAHFELMHPDSFDINHFWVANPFDDYEADFNHGRKVGDLFTFIWNSTFTGSGSSHYDGYHKHNKYLPGSIKLIQQILNHKDFKVDHRHVLSVALQTRSCTMIFIILELEALNNCPLQLMCDEIVQWMNGIKKMRPNEFHHMLDVIQKLSTFLMNKQKANSESGRGVVRSTIDHIKITFAKLLDFDIALLCHEPYEEDISDIFEHHQIVQDKEDEPCPYSLKCLFKWVYSIQVKQKIIDLDFNKISNDLRYQFLCHGWNDHKRLAKWYYNYKPEDSTDDAMWTVVNHKIFGGHDTIVHYILDGIFDTYLRYDPKEADEEGDPRKINNNKDIIQMSRMAANIVKLLAEHKIIREKDTYVKTEWHERTIYEEIQRCVRLCQCNWTWDNGYKQPVFDALFDVFLCFVLSMQKTYYSQPPVAMIKIEVFPDDDWRFTNILSTNYKFRPMMMSNQTKWIQKLLFYGIAPFSIHVHSGHKYSQVSQTCDQLPGNILDELFADALESTDYYTKMAMFAPLIIFPYVAAAKCDMVCLLCNVLIDNGCTEANIIGENIASYLYVDTIFDLYDKDVCNKHQMDIKVYEFLNWIQQIHMHPKTLFEQIFDDKFNNLQFAQYIMQHYLNKLFNMFMDTSDRDLQYLYALVVLHPPNVRDYYYLIYGLIEHQCWSTTQPEYMRYVLKFMMHFESVFPNDFDVNYGWTPSSEDVYDMKMNRKGDGATYDNLLIHTMYHISSQEDDGTIELLDYILSRNGNVHSEKLIYYSLFDDLFALKHLLQHKRFESVPMAMICDDVIEWKKEVSKKWDDYFCELQEFNNAVKERNDLLKSLLDQKCNSEHSQSIQEAIAKYNDANVC
eukprot:97110_1